MKMNWDNLRFFAELARNGSLSGAARGLKVDHSTVARRITGLEESLGVRLFNRLSRGWTLTEAGERMIDHVSMLEKSMFELAAFAQGERSELSGTVRISAPPTFTAMMLMPNVAEFRRRFPGVTLEIAGEMRLANLTRREADIAIRVGRPEGATMVMRRLPDYVYGLYGERDYVRDVAQSDWTFLGFDESLEGKSEQQWLHDYAGVRPFAVRSNDLMAIHSAVLGGAGIAVMPHFLGHRFDQLQCVACGDPALSRDMWMVVHNDIRRSASVRATIDFIVEVLERDRALMETPPPPKASREG